MHLYVLVHHFIIYIHVGCAKFPREMFSEEVQNVPKNAPPPSGPMAFILNSEEQMFTEMRDLNFRAVGQFLSREAKKITALYEVSAWNNESFKCNENYKYFLHVIIICHKLDLLLYKSPCTVCIDCGRNVN